MGAQQSTGLGLRGLEACQVRLDQRADYELVSVGADRRFEPKEPLDQGL